jgi:hypothetical protein
VQDYSRWEWYTVTEILEGPLRNPTHLATALQTKFIKRILSFLRPSNLLFSAQSWTVVRHTALSLSLSSDPQWPMRADILVVVVNLSCSPT